MSNEDGLAMPVTAESTTVRETKDEKAQTEESATPQRTSEGNATPAATAQGSTADDMEKNFSREGNGNMPSGPPQVAQEREKSSAFSGSIHRKPLGDFLGENEKVDREPLKDRIDRLLNDKSIQQIISQQYHALKYEMGTMAQRTADVLACREEYENAKRDFVKALAIMGSHSKSGADVQSVNTVQKYFLTQAMISDIDNKQQKNLKVNMQDAIEEIVIDNVMVDREINRLENCKKKLIEIREVQSVRFMRHGHDDQKGQRLEYRLKLLVDDLQGYKDQLKSTISSLLSKKNNLLTRNLGAYAAVSLLSVQESNKIIVAENKKSSADLKNNTGLSSPVNVRSQACTGKEEGATPKFSNSRVLQNSLFLFISVCYVCVRVCVCVCCVCGKVNIICSI